MIEKTSGSDVGLGCMLFLTGTPIVVMVRSFVMYQLWGYFVVPLGMPQLGMAHLFGLCIMIAVITPSNGKELSKNEGESFSEKVFTSIASSIGLSLLFWGAGFVCYLLM